MVCADWKSVTIPKINWCHCRVPRHGLLNNNNIPLNVAVSIKWEKLSHYRNCLINMIMPILCGKEINLEKTTNLDLILTFT